MATKNNNSSSTVSTKLVNDIKKKSLAAIDNERNNTYKKQAERTMKNTQLSEARKNDAINRTRMSSALNPSKRLSKEDSNTVRNTSKDYFANNEKAKISRQMQTSNPTRARRYREENMSKAERDEYDRMEALDTKTNDVSAFVSGAFSKLPGSRQLRKAYDKAFDKTGDVSSVNMNKNLKTQSPLAYTGGELYQNLINYGIANKALEGVKGFDKVGNKIAGVTDEMSGMGSLESSSEFAKALANGKAINKSKFVADLLRGQTADTLLDTLPQLADDISDGKSASEIAKNIGKNELVNLGFNLVPGGLSYLADNRKTLRNLNNLKSIQGLDGMSDTLKADIPSLMSSSYADDIARGLKDYDPEMTEEGLKGVDYIVNGNLRYSPDEFIENFSTDKNIADLVDFDTTDSYLKNFFDGQEMAALAKDQSLPYDVMDDLSSVARADLPMNNDLYSEYEPIRQIARENLNKQQMQAFVPSLSNADMRRANAIASGTGTINSTEESAKASLDALYKNGFISEEEYAKRLANIKQATRYTSLPSLKPSPVGDVDSQAKNVLSQLEEGLSQQKKAPGRENINDVIQTTRNIEPSVSRPTEDRLDEMLRSIERAEAEANYRNMNSVGDAIPQTERTISDSVSSAKDNEISQHYETMRNSEMFKDSEAQLKLEAMKKNGVFDKGGVENRLEMRDKATREFASNPQEVLSNVLNKRHFESGIDVDRSALCIQHALDTNDNALLNTLVRRENINLTSAGRTLRAVQDNYIPTEGGTISQGVKYMLGEADKFLNKGGKAVDKIKSVAEDIVNNRGSLEMNLQMFGMNDSDIKSIAEALDMGADAQEITKMIAMQQRCGTTQISDETIQTIKDIYNEISANGYGINSKQRADLEARAFSVLANEIGGKKSFQQKWDAWRYLAMLGNTRTHIRNVFGNTMQYMVSEIKDNIGGLIESVADGISSDGIQRTKSVLNRLDESDNALIKLARSDADNEAFKMLNDSGHKYNEVKDMVNQNSDAFDSKFLNFINNKNSALLEGEDYFGLKNKYSKSLARYLKANGVDGSIFEATDDASKELLDKAREYAVEEAKKATFHEYSALAETLSNASQKLRYGENSNLATKAAGWVGESLLPFKKTPINVLKQGLKYSPLSLAKSVSTDLYKLSKGTISSSKMIDDLASGLTGTGIMALGAFLANQGLLNGKGNEDYEVKNAETKQGKQEYAIQIGDKSYTIDWLAPFSLPLFVGAELMLSNNDSEDSLDKVLNAITTIGNPITEMSMLQGINDALEQLSYGGAATALETLAGNSVSGYLSQGIPTVLGQVARSVDPTRRSTYSDEDAGLKKQFERSRLKAINKIPGLSSTNEEYRDAWGETEENTGGNVLGRLAYNMLSPGYYADGSKTTATDRELARLYEATGTSAYSNVANGKVGDKRLSREDFTKFQKMYGQNNKDLATSLIKDELYGSLSDEDKSEVINNAYAISKKFANYEIAGKELSNTEQKQYEIFKKSGAQGLAKSLIEKKLEAIDKDEKTAKALEYGFLTKEGNGSPSAYEKAVEAVGDDPVALRKYSEMKKAISSTETGVNKNDEVTHMTFNDKSRQLYEDKGESGLAIVSDFKKNGVSKAPDIIDKLNGMNLSDEDKAYYFSYIYGKKLAKVPSLMDNPVDQYNWYYIKSLIDADGNGNIKKSEKANIPSLVDYGFDNAYVQRVMNEKWYN